MSPPQPLFTHAQAFEVKPVTRRPRFDPQPTQGAGEASARGQGCPVPQRPTSAASRLHAVQDVNHLLPRPAAARCLRESRALGRILPPHLSCACYLCPTAAPGQRQRWPGSSRGQNRFPSRRRPESPEGSRPPLLFLGSSPVWRKGSVSERKLGREELCCFRGTAAGWEGGPDCAWQLRVTGGG